MDFADLSVKRSIALFHAIICRSQSTTKVGSGRKSMIFKTLGVTPDHALNGTIALNMVCLMNGANILRVHDVKEAKETVRLFEAMKNVES